MPPVLHPKSLSTASLFTTTAAIAFLVVGAPHILPCPAATKRQYADDGRCQASGAAEAGSGGKGKPKKKCPVPRIGGGGGGGRGG